jgi:hypothetical protein
MANRIPKSWVLGEGEQSSPAPYYLHLTRICGDDDDIHDDDDDDVSDDDDVFSQTLHV